MQNMVLRISLRPGTAEILHRVALALGTTIEDIVTRHLETIGEAVNYTPAAPDTHGIFQPMKVVLSEGLAIERR